MGAGLGGVGEGEAGELADQDVALEEAAADDPINIAREEAVSEVRDERRERRQRRRATRKSDERSWIAGLRRILGGRPEHP
jgi:hypothetical protein